MSTTIFRRRSVLRGLGAAAGLLAPLHRALKAQAQEPGPQNMKLAIMMHSNGSHPDWTPSGSGNTYTMSPALAPLEKVRNDINILRRLTCGRGGGNPHAASSISWMVAAKSRGAEPSIDQLVAQRMSGTPIRSLELALGRTEALSVVNRSNLPAMDNPLEAYARIEKLIKPSAATPSDPKGMEQTQQMLRSRKSVFDFVAGEVDTFSKRLSGAERGKVDQYLTAVRDLERQLGATVSVQAGPGCRPLSIAGPVETSPGGWPKTSRLLLDVTAAAFACGVTRVATFQWGGSQSNASIPFISGMSNWHSVSHGNLDGAEGKLIIQMQAFWAGEFAYFVDKLKTLGILNSTIAVWGTQNGNTNARERNPIGHDPSNAPFIVAGNAGGRWKTGRIVDCGNRYTNDLYTAIANACGIDIQGYGEAAWSKGPLPLST